VRELGLRAAHEQSEKRAITEMKHAERLIERLLFLDGAPMLSELNKLTIGADVKAQFENDLALELGAVASYNARIKLAREVGDNATRELFEELLAEEEGHVDSLERSSTNRRNRPGSLPLPADPQGIGGGSERWGGARDGRAGESITI